MRLGWTEREYRKFKSDPANTAHEFQRQMCADQWDEIEFDRIPGRALFGLVSRQGKDGSTPSPATARPSGTWRAIPGAADREVHRLPLRPVQGRGQAKGLAAQWTD